MASGSSTLTKVNGTPRAWRSFWSDLQGPHQVVPKTITRSWEAAGGEIGGVVAVGGAVLVGVAVGNGKAGIGSAVGSTAGIGIGKTVGIGIR
jgi:hypothetical protein